MLVTALGLLAPETDKIPERYIRIRHIAGFTCYSTVRGVNVGFAGFASVAFDECL
jgi:hypothetical protein